MYCTLEIEKTVHYLLGYEDKNWEQLKTSLRSLYWSFQVPENTTASLQELVRSARNGIIDLNVFILQY